MILNVINDDLFKQDRSIPIAHCISADCALGKGIAKTINQMYNLNTKLLMYAYNERLVGGCIFECNVFNLITKKLYDGKPSYASLKESLINMRNIVNKHGIKIINMPKIGTGLDKLRWDRVEEIIKTVFDETDITINVYYI